MRFEWNEQKNATNQSKHSIDFETASFVFDDPTFLTEEAKTVNSEKRWMTVGSIEGEMIAVLYTMRGTPPDDLAIRIISARRAHRTERMRYEEVVRRAESKAEGASGKA